MVVKDRVRQYRLEEEGMVVEEKRITVRVAP